MTEKEKSQLGQLYDANYDAELNMPTLSPWATMLWIGAQVCVLPGVTIGDNTVIGAGSVVTRDIPSGVVAVGNPCHVVRRLEDSKGNSHICKD